MRSIEALPDTEVRGLPSRRQTHLPRPGALRWNVVAFGFTVMILGIVVPASVWIMHNATSKMAHAMTQAPRRSFRNADMPRER